MDFKERFHSWIEVATHPRDVFKKELKNANYSDAILNIAGAAAAATILKLFFGSIFAAIFSSPELAVKQLRTLGIATSGTLSAGNMALLALTNFVAIAVLLGAGWAAGGWVIYKVSGWFSARGKLVAQLYLTSLFIPAFATILTFLSFMMSVVIARSAVQLGHVAFTGSFYLFAGLIFAALLYNIYEYIIALSAVHKYGEGTGFASCILGGLIIVLVIIVVLLTTFSNILGILFV